MESEEENQSQDVFEGRWLKDEHDRFLVGCFFNYLGII